MATLTRTCRKVKWKDNFTVKKKFFQIFQNKVFQYVFKKILETPFQSESEQNHNPEYS